MRKTSSTYQNQDGKVLTVEVNDSTLMISIDGVAQWAVAASETARSVGERQAQAIASELNDWANEANAHRMALRHGDS
jgi:hypothetical protein